MMKRTLWMLLASLLLLAACGNQPAPAAIAPAGAAVTNITVQDLKTQLGGKEHIFLLDVRSAEEYTNDGHVAGSTLIPLPDLARRASELPTDRPIVCICRSGNRSTTACNQLANQGFTQLRNVQGGMIAWGQAGYPIAYGQ
ncbi:MAG: rhodanese-like domain-containing protein [Chloroflexi bacterium SZAS-1]|nr:rhodanese-like domain-containing protein [Chloroflexi bacterium SZAS-1]